jgi:hypothetical protein
MIVERKLRLEGSYFGEVRLAFVMNGKAYEELERVLGKVRLPGLFSGATRTGHFRGQRASR